MSAAYPYDLGEWRRLTPAAPLRAAEWFNRGLIWCYGFHHEEAIRCFEQGVQADPGWAMNHWGIAYAIGPNYNKGWDFFAPDELSEAYQRIDAALAAADRASADPIERALIDALRMRYPSDRKTDVNRWHAAYADAMREVHSAYPEDLDVACLFAEALMNRTPWALWDLATGVPAEGADTAEAMLVLERAMAQPGGMAHPGLLHFYIHLMEMSPSPQQALKAADALRGLVPDSGHLRHMPTHIDVLCGHYQQVVRDNDAAIVADRKTLERDGALNFYSLYRCHDYHFKLYGAMLLGHSGAAIDAADEMAHLLTPELLAVESPPMADWLEGFVPMRLHVLIRFGRWQEILDTAFPADASLYCTTTAMLHYARAVALAVTGQTAAARDEADAFAEAVRGVPDTRYLFNNTCLDILAVAGEMMAGELSYREGDFDTAFARLRAAVALDDALPYDEPWGWMQPTRHALGALLLEQDRVAEAAEVYRADLGFDATLARPCQHPENVWSLHGYHECLTRLGRADEAAIMSQRLDLALARTDVTVRSSCFCRGHQPD